MVKKFLLLGLSLLVSGASYADTLSTCKSADFNPANFDGQGIEITQNAAGEVTKAKKLPGSWFCDDKEVVNPKLLTKAGGQKVYELTFGCDDYNGRLIVPDNTEALTKVKYEFSYADDDAYRRSKEELTCTQ